MSRFYISGGNERNPNNFRKGGRRELVAHIRGWNKGVIVEAFVDDDGFDTFRIYETKGSNAPSEQKFIRSFTDKRSAGPRDVKGRLK